MVRQTSPWPRSATRVRVIADLLALIDALNLSSVDVVGHDWGAFASWALVLEHPELFRRHVALSVVHPRLFSGEFSFDGLKENWYMYLNSQVSAPDLYRLDGCG